MKKWVTAILAAGITISSLTAVFAANDNNNEGAERTALRAEEKTQELYKQAAPFLTKKIILRNKVTYTPYTMEGQVTKEMAELGFPVSTGDDGALPFGQLVAVSAEGDFSAFIMNVSFAETEESKKSVEPFFEKEQNVAAIAGLAAANFYLLGAEPVINGWIAEGIRSYNRTSADKLPEDFARVQLKDIEPIARLGENTYAVGARIISEADGFLMPLYLRGYLMKKGDRYRVLLAITSDAERNYMKASIEELMKTSFAQ